MENIILFLILILSPLISFAIWSLLGWVLLSVFALLLPIKVTLLNCMIVGVVGTVIGGQ